jgi:hypothetical protein
MLNELNQVVVALNKRGVPLVVPHAAVDPMGKSELLLIEVDSHAKPRRLKLLPKEVAGTLVRIAHGSEGSSFPGFNLPLPLRVLPHTIHAAKLKRLVEAQRSKDTAASPLAEAVAEIIPETSAAAFTASQTAQFRRSMQELVGWLKADFAASGSELANFRTLLDVVVSAKLELVEFAEMLAACIRGSLSEANRGELVAFAEMLFGKTHLPKCKDELASEAYWRAKKAADEKLQTPVFLDLADGNTQELPVADPRTARLLNQFLLGTKPPSYDARSRSASVTTPRRKKPSSRQPPPTRDAYTGKDCAIPDKFPEPKLALLGNTKLFSNNTVEAGCFYRYGLGDSETFKVSAESAETMSGALFTLAGDDLALSALGGKPSLGRTCRAIPGNREGKQDLLIAYLEDEPDAPDPYVELFGNEAASYDSPDFAATAKPVLDALKGKVAANPNQLIRLIAIAALDKANKQVSLSRSFTVREIVEAAKAWQAGAANCPPVTLPFFDKETKKPVTRSRTVPSPLDTASVLNKVWPSRGAGGFKPEFHRILSASDAYDIFLAPPSLREFKTRFALQTLLARMPNVFASAAVVKSTWDFKALNEPARWCVLKAVALTGIFLHQLGQTHGHFMKEPTYQIGRLLAYADSLHQQYCKHVRGDKTPTQLIGNALFATALEQPVFALARLAERLVPYQAWAKTFKNTKPEVKSGYEKTLLRLIGDCAAHFIEERDGTFVIRVDEVPARMSDTDKAKLLLGYLADHPKPETQND